MSITKLRVFETFAGIGAQQKALSRICKDKTKDFEIVNISEWDAYSLISKDAIHNGNIKPVKIDEFLAKRGIFEYSKYLNKKSFSLNGKDLYEKFKTRNIDFLKRLIVADVRTKNLGSIIDIHAKDIKKEFDLLTYSFPCQDLSVASMGRGKGMKKEDKTRSGLLWEIQRILDELNNKNNFKMPKYLLLENVENMLNATHIEEYNKWIDYLDQKLGYKTFTLKLNSYDFNNPQIRKRVFALSVHKKFKSAINYISKLIKNEQGINENEKLKNFIINNYGENRKDWTAKKWDTFIKNNFLKLKNDSKSRLYLEEMDASVNDTPSRRRMVNDGKILNNGNIITRINTVTTKQDRIPNSGNIIFENNKQNSLDFRFLTPRECFLIMGFDDKDFDRVRNEAPFINSEKIWKQAGNSIVVTVLEAIFKFIYKIEEEVKNG